MRGWRGLGGGDCAGALNGRKCCGLCWVSGWREQCWWAGRGCWASEAAAERGFTACVTSFSYFSYFSGCHRTGDCSCSARSPRRMFRP